MLLQKKKLGGLKEKGGQKKKKKKKKKKRKKKKKKKIRKSTKIRKKDYVVLTRKLRKHIAEMKRSGEITKDKIDDIRKKIRNRIDRSKAHLREHLGGMSNENIKKTKKRK